MAYRSELFYRFGVEKSLSHSPGSGNSQNAVISGANASASYFIDTTRTTTGVNHTNNLAPVPVGESLKNNSSRDKSFCDEAFQEPPLLVDIREVARMLGLSVNSVIRNDQSGRLGPKAVRIGRRKLWNRAEIIEWVDAGCPGRREWMAAKRNKSRASQRR